MQDQYKQRIIIARVIAVSLSDLLDNDPAIVKQAQMYFQCGLHKEHLAFAMPDANPDVFTTILQRAIKTDNPEPIRTLLTRVNSNIDWMLDQSINRQAYKIKVQTAMQKTKPPEM